MTAAHTSEPRHFMKCGQCDYVRKFHGDPERFCSSTCAAKYEAASSPLQAVAVPARHSKLGMRQVSEKVALKGGRWVSADDVERMAREMYRAMYPNDKPPVNCLLCDVVGEAVKRLTATQSKPGERA